MMLRVPATVVLPAAVVLLAAMASCGDRTPARSDDAPAADSGAARSAEPRPAVTPSDREPATGDQESPAVQAASDSESPVALPYPVPGPGRVVTPSPDLGPPSAGQTVAIPGGIFLLGSMPGSPGRDPSREADLVPVEIAPFEIDRLPFPNDPAKPPLVNVTLREAAGRCESAGGRLCGEVEWEFACRGIDNRVYPYGDDYRGDAHGGEHGPASPFGVSAMTALFEWTGSDWLDAGGARSDRMAPVRGAHPSEGDAASRRCAARTAVDPTRGSPRIGFRCCRGRGRPEPYDPEPIRRAFRQGPVMTDPMFARLVRSIPEMRRVHADPRIQSEEQLRKALLRSRRTEAAGPGWVYSVQPVLWLPADGDEMIAIVGRSGKDLFAGALYTTGVPGLYAHAASMVLTSVADDEGIILYGGTRSRTLLGWGECDDCKEGGSFEYHPDRTVTVGHRW